MDSYFRIALTAALGLALAGTSWPIIAADENEPELTEIIVTAQKRVENLVEVPISVTVFTDKERDTVGIETIQDLTDYTPGVAYIQSLDRMTIRGVGRETNNLSVDPSVATYLDGFYSSFNRVGDSTTLFIAQEELLKGPQGTLYGRNSIGGVFNLNTVRPSNEWEAEVRGGFGNFKAGDAEGTISGPLTDNLRVRISVGEYLQDYGYLQSIVTHQADGYGKKNNQEYQIQLAGNIGTAFDWFLKADHRYWDAGYGASTANGPYNTTSAGCGSATAGPLICAGSLGPNPQYNTGPGLNPAVPQLTVQNPGVTNLLRDADNSPNREFLKGDQVYVFNGIFHMGFADLKYVGGWYSYDYDLETDYDNTPRDSYVYTPTIGPVGNVTINSAQAFRYSEIKHYWSNELNLISTTDSALQYTAGLYQYHERFSQPQSVESIIPQAAFKTPCAAFPPAPCVLINPALPAGTGLAPPNTNGAPYFVNQHTLVQTLAGFGELDWKFIEHWKATLGVRYTRDKRDSLDTARYLFWDPTQFGSFAPAFELGFPGVGAAESADGTWNRQLSASSHAWTGTAGLEWSPSSDAMAYIKYSRGYLDAGINSGAGLVANPYTRPEFSNSYEAGWKQSIGSRALLSTSVFYNDFQGAQYPLTLLGGPVAVAVLYNINERSYGADLEGSWAATDALRLMATYGYLHSVFTDHGAFQNTITNQSVTLDGNQTPDSPKNTFSANAVYTFRFSPGSFALSGSYIWRDSTFYDAFDNPQTRAPSYGAADFRGTWTSADNRYSVIGYLRNAFNKVAFDSIGYAAGFPANQPSFSVIPPRVYGIELRVRFGARAK